MNLRLRCCFIILGCLLSVGLKGQDDNSKLLENAIKERDTARISELISSDSSILNRPILFDGFLSNVRQFPIHLAIRFGDEKTINLLLNLGADPTNTHYSSAILSGKETSSLELLIEHQNLEVLRALLSQLRPSAESFTNALYLASQKEETAKVRFLLSHGEKFLIKNQQ